MKTNRETERRVPGRSGILGRRGPHHRRASSALAVAASLARPVPGHLECFLIAGSVSVILILAAAVAAEREEHLQRELGRLAGDGQLGRLLEVCLFEEEKTRARRSRAG